MLNASDRLERNAVIQDEVNGSGTRGGPVASWRGAS